MPEIQVPFLDLPGQQREVAEAVRKALDPIFENAAFIGGPAVSEFENNFAAAHDSSHVVSVRSGTAALHLGLQALGVGLGDEVVVPAFSFIATASVVAHLGAVPVFADVDGATACLDPEALRASLTPKTKAVIAVHLYGQAAPMGPLLEAAGSVPIIEDCAQSHLARHRGRLVGNFGRLGAFSFYPTKNLGAAGDGGAVTTQDQDLAARIRRLSNHGRTGHYEHGELGWNERLDAVQAAVLNVKLEHLPRWTDERRKHARAYGDLLSGAAPWGEPLVLPRELPGNEHVYHLYVVRHPQRDKLAETLAQAGVATGVHYPGILPRQPAFASFASGAGEFPIAQQWADNCLALPVYPGMTEDQLSRVAEVIHSL